MGSEKSSENNLKASHLAAACVLYLPGYKLDPGVGSGLRVLPLGETQAWAMLK